MNRRLFLTTLTLATAAAFAQESPLEKKLNCSNILCLAQEYKYSDENLARYNKWVEQTIKESEQQKSFAIIINKADYKLLLIKDGKFHSQYNIELGFNPIDDKHKEGDGCTPEGLYEVIAKKDRSQTIFYRALLIDYPSQKDLKEFKELKKKGTVPETASAGGMIEIHGNGSGKSPKDGGHNWTLGCIALSNEDIDRIFPFVGKGTRIAIVRYATKNWR